MERDKQIIERLDNLTPKLYDLGNTLYSKWGTESYVERCTLFDVRDELLKIIEQLKISELTHIESMPEKEEEEKEDDFSSYVACDVCGRHPSVVVINEFGTFCKEHAKYI